MPSSLKMTTRGLARHGRSLQPAKKKSLGQLARKVRAFDLRKKKRTQGSRSLRKSLIQEIFGVHGSR